MVYFWRIVSNDCSDAVYCKNYLELFNFVFVLSGLWDQILKTKNIVYSHLLACAKWIKELLILIKLEAQHVIIVEEQETKIIYAFFFLCTCTRIWCVIKHQIKYCMTHRLLLITLCRLKKDERSEEREKEKENRKMSRFVF